MYIWKERVDEVESEVRRARFGERGSETRPTILQAVLTAA
jgi:hypothetical protein